MMRRAFQTSVRPDTRVIPQQRPEAQKRSQSMQSHKRGRGRSAINEDARLTGVAAPAMP